MPRLRFRRSAGGAAPTPPPDILTITGTFPSPVIVGDAVTFTPALGGGVPPYVVTSTGTALPANLTLTAATGAIGGSRSGAGTTTGCILTLNDSVGTTAATLALAPIVAITPAPPADLTVPIHTTDDQFVDITAWLDTVFDNNITVTVAGAVGMRVWGYESLQTNGQTRTWVDRKLREMLVAVTRAAAVANGTWTFSAKNGPGETGTLSTYIVTLAVQATPVTTTTAGGVLDKAGNVIFPLSRLGSATDWVLNTQSDTVNAPLALWDYNLATSARIGWAALTPGTYLGTKKVAAPTAGLAAYTATVSSAQLGITNRVVTVDVNAAIVKIGPVPSQDTTSMNQLIDVVRNGTSAGTVVWGLTILCAEGVFNTTAATQAWTPKQPTGTAPASPYGSNASPSWDYADGWNANWLTIKGELPPVVTTEGDAPICQTQIQTASINVASLTSQVLGYRFTNLDLCKGTSPSPVSLYIRDDSSTVRGIHAVAIDHCTRAVINMNYEGDHSDALFIAYNDFDNNAPDFTGSALGIVGTDCQIIGNLWRNWDGDMMNGHTYCSVVGNGKNKTQWNVSVDKKLGLGSHSDFSQTHAFLAKKYLALTPGSDCDLGPLGPNWSLKGKGKIFDADDVGYCGLYFQNGTLAGAGFAVDDVLSNGSGRTGTVVEVVGARELRVQLTDSTSPFTQAELLTATPSGTTAVTNCTTTVSAVVGSHLAGHIVRNAGDTKRAEILAVNSATSWNIKMTVGAVFTSGEALTNLTTGGTATKGAFASSATTTRPGGMVHTADIGKCTSDCQGFYNGASQAPVTGVEHYRSDLNHIYDFYGWIIEGLDSYGLMRLPPAKDSAGCVIVNNLVTPPWGTISEVGTGGYYDKGRFVPVSVAGQQGTIFPTQSFISGVSALGSRIIGRNVFMCGAGFQDVSNILANDLIGSDFGNPTNSTTAIPSQVVNAITDPGGTATRSCIADIIEDYTPVPGGILTTQGTPVDFGPIVPEIDHNRHTADRTALAALV